MRDIDILNLLRIRLYHECLAKALAGGIVIDNQTVGTPNLVAVANLCRYGYAQSGNIKSISHLGTSGNTKKAVVNSYLMTTCHEVALFQYMRILELIANIEVDGSTLCISVEGISIYNLFCVGSCAQVRCKCIELDVRTFVEILISILPYSATAKEVRCSVLSKFLEPMCILSCITIQCPADFATCQLLGSNKSSFCFTEELSNKYICWGTLSTTTDGTGVIAF